MFLNLIVLRSYDVELLGQFYEALGMSFVREQHGSGPEHLACVTDGTTFEIYPCVEENTTQGMRIGFCVDQLSTQFSKAIAHGAEVLMPPRSSPWGERAVIRDPAGHVVELLRPTGRANVGDQLGEIQASETHAA